MRKNSEHSNKNEFWNDFRKDLDFVENQLKEGERNDFTKSYLPENNPQHSSIDQKIQQLEKILASEEKK